MNNPLHPPDDPKPPPPTTLGEIPAVRKAVHWFLLALFIFVGCWILIPLLILICLVVLGIFT